MPFYGNFFLSVGSYNSLIFFLYLHFAYNRLSPVILESALVLWPGFIVAGLIGNPCNGPRNTFQNPGS